jgi:uncharacterized protein YegP (UPF0339 family)
MTFLIDEDNAGRYHWMIVADGGEKLVRSAGFGSFEEAKDAAGVVRHGASRASFEGRPGGPSLRLGGPSPVDLQARGGSEPTGDRLDAERWLDEGGSFSSKTVIR